MKIGLITCGKSKRNSPCLARDLYTGAFFRYGRQFLERTCSDWRILSAKYGVLAPIAIVAPYELVVKASGLIKAAPHIELSENEREQWYRNVNADLKRLFPQAHFVALISSSYAPALRDLDCEFPLAGLRMFERVKRLRELLHDTTGKRVPV
jgi:hypothetical protein